MFDSIAKYFFAHTDSFVSLTVLALFFILVFKGHYIEIGKHGLKANSNKTKKSPHVNCKHVKDVIVVLRNRDDLRAKINKIENRKMPRDIMRIAEQGIKDLKEVLKNNYVLLLNDKEGKDSLHLPQIKLYKTMLDSFDSIILRECRRMMHENNWIDKELQGEWNNYVTKHIGIIIQSYSALLDDVYVLENPCREEIREYNKVEIISYATEKLRKLLNEMLAVNKHWQKEIKKIEDSMESEMNNLLGCFEEG